jgi:hypothetical protein
MTESAKITFAGSCLCGTLAFEFGAPSLWCTHCHCSLCRRAHGSAFVTWVGVHVNRFNLIRQESLRWHHSSEKAERGFCSHCGSTVFFRSTRWPNEIHVTRANIAGELDIEPSAHATYGAGQVSWFPFEDRLPHRDDDGG